MNCAQSCIHCGKCTKVCVFLDKYKMDLEGFSLCPDLAYHCFLCGECRRVCPNGIDGKGIALTLRQRQLDNGLRLGRNGYRFLLMEKENYPFRSYKRVKSETAFFPGCNFPGYYPKTTRLLSERLFGAACITTAYDCCGKPVAELGLHAGSQRITHRINQSLQRAGVKELVVLCPNCYDHLQGKLDVSLVDIYTKLSQLGIGLPVNMKSASLFLPCPDRDRQQIRRAMQPFLSGGSPELLRAQCCGAGGCASVKEPALAQQLRQSFVNAGAQPMYTYCATCAGVIQKENIPVQQVLCEIMQTNEQPAKGVRSVFNRAIFGQHIKGV